MNTHLDVRTPIGLMFALYGVVLAIYGLTSDPAIYRRSLDININLWWGLALLVFGAVMLFLAWRAQRAVPPAPPRRPRMRRAIVLLAIAGFGGQALAGDANWPQFRGPQASGVALDEATPASWNLERGENVRWKRPLPGLAHSSPIIWGDYLYVTTAVTPGQPELKVGLYGDITPVAERDLVQWRLLALSKATGRVLWDVLGHEAVPRVKRHPKSTHCSSTPATDGRYVVAIFGSEGLFCFDVDGRLLWRKDLGPMEAAFFAVPTAQWGFASSPIINRDQVIVLCDVLQDSFLAAFALADGRELWRTPRKDVPTWGTPTLVEAAGGKQIVVNGWRHSGGYDSATGKELWRLDGGGDIPVPTPVFGHGLIYLTSAHGRFRPIRAVRPEASGDITPPELGQTNAAIAWVHPRQGNYMQTPLVLGDFLYGCTDAGGLTCFDARTGTIRYSERLGSGGQGFTASPVAAGGKLYFASEVGNVFVVVAGPKFSVLATNALGETCMATPAVSGGTLFFRTRHQLVALGPKP